MPERRDVWIHNEDGFFVVTSTALGDPQNPFLQVDQTSWKRGFHKGVFLAVSLVTPGPFVLRVVVDAPLIPEEQEGWVDRWETPLRLPRPGLVISGDSHYMLGDGYPEFLQTLPEVAAGDYLAELYTFLPGPNGVATVARAAPEKLAAYFRRTRPGQSFPGWLARLCVEKPKLDPGHESEWKKARQAPDPILYVDFLLRLTPLVTPPLRLQLKGGRVPPVPLAPRLPAVCPLGLETQDLLGRPETPLQGPIRLTFRAPVADLLQECPPRPITGTPVSLPASDFSSVYAIANFCYQKTFIELHLTVPSGIDVAPTWPSPGMGVRAERLADGWRVVFEGMNARHLHALPHVAPVLGSLPDGVILELMTADPDTAHEANHPGWHRYRGRIQGGQWIISETYPACDSSALQAALDLVEEMRTGQAFLLRGDPETEALEKLLKHDSTLRELVKDRSVTIEGGRVRLMGDDPFHKEILTQKIFRLRFSKVWPVYTNDESDALWNSLMDQLTAFREFRSPPSEGLIFTGQKGNYYATLGRPDQQEAASEWDEKLAACGFKPLGRLTCDRVRELTLLGYAQAEGVTYAVVGLGGLAPPAVLDYYTLFPDGTSVTTTTNLFADGNLPQWGIYRKAFPKTSPSVLLEKHESRVQKHIVKHGEPGPVGLGLKPLAEALDEFFVRYDA